MHKPSPILITHVSASSRSVKANLQDGVKWQWIYLGRNYARYEFWASQLEGRAERISLGEQLQCAAQRLRAPFLNLLANLAETYHRRSDSSWAVAWWTSRLAERNTMVSPLFLHCCYLQAFSDLVGQIDNGLCVIAESPAVLKCIQRLHVPVRRIRGWRERIGEIVWPLRVLAGFCWFVYRSVRDWHSARATRELGKPLAATCDPVVLIHAYADDTCLQPSSKFVNRYFGPLGEWLAEAGYRLLILPTLINLRCSRTLAFARLRQAEQLFLIPADYYRAADYWNALINGARQMRLAAKRIFLETLEISQLAREETRRQIMAGDLQDVMFAYLILRLAQRGHGIKAVIHPFENHVAEKALNFGLRTYMPQTVSIGFQHGGLYPLWLCYGTTPSEAKIAPLPDRIVCNGPLFLDFLAQESFPTDRLALGCSLRYQYLFNAKVSENRALEDCITVTLPMDPSAATELLSKCLVAFQQPVGKPLMVKSHPMMPLKRILSTIGIAQLPRGFFAFEGTMAAALCRACIVISCASTTLLEAVADGKPAVVVGRDLDLDMNPLAWWPDLFPVTRAPDEIRSQVLHWLNLPEEGLQQYRYRSLEILRSCFLPVSEERMRAFTACFDSVSQQCHVS